MTQSTEPPPSPPSRGPEWAKLATIAAVVLAALLTARRVYRSPYSASDLHTTPDEVEYAVCAQRLATLGRYDMDFDGVGVRPHSTPWFSAVIAPVYVAAPGEIGNGIWAVLAFAVVGMVALHRVGERVAGPLGGALAVCAVLWMPLFPEIARQIMTDVPGAALGFIALWLFLRWSDSSASVRESLIAGVLVALAFALRSVFLALLIPFAWRAWRVRERRVAHCAALLAPLAAVLVANAIYNHVAFGDWHRTGYQYWLAVPYDYPDLLVSLSNVGANLRDFKDDVALWPLELGAGGVLALAFRRPRGWRELLTFSAVSALPISALHLAYFYSDLRFHVYLLALAAVIGAVGIASVAPQKLREHPLIGPAVLIAAFFALPPLGNAMPWFLADGQPPRRATADLIHRQTPDGCVVISDLEPVYVAALAPLGSHRTYLAISRDVEFASKVLVRERVDRELAAPRNPFDHAAPGLLAHGGQWAVANTADHMHDQIEAWVRSGRPVFYANIYAPNRAAIASMLGSSLRFERPDARLMRVVSN
jgi:hypothetical protein